MLFWHMGGGGGCGSVAPISLYLGIGSLFGSSLPHSLTVLKNAVSSVLKKILKYTLF